MLQVSSHCVENEKKKKKKKERRKRKGKNPGDTPLNGLYRYVRSQRVWFLAVLVINRVSIFALVLNSYFVEEATSLHMQSCNLPNKSR